MRYAKVIPVILPVLALFAATPASADERAKIISASPGWT